MQAVGWQGVTVRMVKVSTSRGCVAGPEDWAEGGRIGPGKPGEAAYQLSKRSECISLSALPAVSSASAPAA